ncbi:MAG TPA: sigma 54-interacting transcriptional regulator [Bacteroidales bacterium]|nr:sigma 54-interacting transcriptional regulator [Bacteroidales bacterium]HNS45703.1 sigma 54-interacting transcriptional regulator [Bacteroidales bacterium]
MTTRKGFQELLKLMESRGNAEDLPLLFETIVGTSEAVETWINPEGQIYYISGTSFQLTGYTNNEILENPDLMEKIIHPQDRAVWAEEVERAIRNRDVKVSYEIRIIARDGIVKWIETSWHPLKDVHGRYYGWRAITTDISGRKQLEKAHQITQTRYQAILDSQTELIVRHDIDSTITFVNESFARFVGVGVNDLIGMKWIAFLPQEIALQVKTVMEALTPENPSASIELQNTRHDGVIRWINWSSTGIFSKNGVLVELQVVGHDITEEKNLYQELVRSNEEISLLNKKFATALDYTYDIEGWIIPGRELLYISPSCERLTGYSQDDFTKNVNFIEEIIHPEDRLVFKEHRLKRNQSHESISCRYRIINRQGKTCWLEQIDNPVIDEEGKDLGYRFSVHDISEHITAKQNLENALEEVKKLEQKLESENLYLKDLIRPRISTPGVVANSEGMKRVMELAQKVAATDSAVLITGETGTGKELIARTIHQQSRRSKKLMITVNCAALPASLIESELFGREKGAYTGALTRQIGRFELANHSTIFLDEIGEMPLELQVKLLRILQFGEFERIGSPETHKTNVRIIAATNKDLQKALDEGTFRKDLFYRLNVFPIQIPPLRDRQDDIAPLVWTFVNELVELTGKRIDTIPRKVMEKLTRYSWPGNVRELRNVIEHAMIITTSRTLDIALPTTYLSDQVKVGTLEEIERLHILAVLKQTHWRVRGEDGAAQILGLNEATLRFRMKKLGIRRPE